MLLTVAAGSGLLLGAGRVSAASGHRLAAPGHAGPGRGLPRLPVPESDDGHAGDRHGPAPGAELRRRGAGHRELHRLSIYDDALIIDAYLAERTTDGRARAQVIGTALLSALAQAAPQGRGLYDDYAPAPLYLAADVQPASGSRTTGDAAWAATPCSSCTRRPGSRPT